MARKGISSLVLMLMLVVGFAGGILFLATTGAGSPHAAPEAQVAQATQAPTSSVQGKELLNQFSAAFEAAAARVNPSVVPIFSEQVTNVQNPFSDFFGDDMLKRFFGESGRGGQQKQTVRSLGSGVIVSKDGYILTNNHVVDGSEKLTVTLSDKKKYTAKVVGRDPQTDIAVIKIEASGDLPVASLGNSDVVKVGQWVIAVGNPFQLMHTVTAGIISAKGRSSMNLADYEDFIQTDASINPGNSGGALADLDGNVIGINTAILSTNGGGGNVGIGFAVPINMARNIMESLISKGKVARGYLGLIPQDIDDNLAKALNLKVTEGSLVGDVTPGGPADKAGIKRGDIITGINGSKVTSSVQLRNLVAESAPGSSAKLTVLREGKERDITVTLGERPKDLASREGDNAPEEEQTGKKLGLTVQTLTADNAGAYGYSNEHGVIIVQVTPGSVAEDAGLRKGDLIKEVNRKEVQTSEQFNTAIRAMKDGESAAFLVRRGPNTFFVAVQLA